MTKKPERRLYSLEYVLELPQGASLDEFLDQLVELVESFGGYIGGAASPYVEADNGEKKQKGHQRTSKQPRVHRVGRA